MSTYLKIMDSVNKVLKIILFILLFTSMLSMALQVIFRFILNMPLSWSGELSRYLMIWMTFIGASLAVRHHRLIKLEVLLLKLSSRAKWLIGVFAGIISILFYIILMVYGISIIQTVGGQQTPALEISMAIPYSAIPVGAFLLICNTIASLLDGNKGEIES
jgi:TRAP-type C4-dicarboxylate transport system permease small subunit